MGRNLKGVRLPRRRSARLPRFGCPRPVRVFSRVRPVQRTCPRLLIRPLGRSLPPRQHQPRLALLRRNLQQKTLAQVPRPHPDRIQLVYHSQCRGKRLHRERPLVLRPRRDIQSPVSRS